MSAGNIGIISATGHYSGYYHYWSFPTVLSDFTGTKAVTGTMQTALYRGATTVVGRVWFKGRVNPLAWCQCSHLDCEVVERIRLKG